jgi:hypothetical protein
MSEEKEKKPPTNKMQNEGNLYRMDAKDSAAADDDDNDNSNTN